MRSREVMPPLDDVAFTVESSLETACNERIATVG
jgi:hypothetical protein